MNTEKFAESAKTKKRGAQTHPFRSEPLKQAATKIIKILGATAKETPPVAMDLVELLSAIKSKQLWLEERTLDGEPELESFDDFLKRFRRSYVSSADGDLSGAYRHVQVAVTFLNLRDAGVSPLPTKPSQLIKVATAETEAAQVELWKDVAAKYSPDKITPAIIAQTAQELGFHSVTSPSPSSSSKLKAVRAAWGVFKAQTTAAFGAPIEPHFQLIEPHLKSPPVEKKKQKKRIIADETQRETDRTNDSLTSEEPPIPKPQSLLEVVVPEIVEQSEPKTETTLKERSSADRLANDQRPLAVIHDGAVHIAFTSGSQKAQYESAGFPSIRGTGYKWVVGKFKGVWVRPTSGDEDTELNLINQCLASAAAKIAQTLAA